jgi:hypothetical protein
VSGWIKWEKDLETDPRFTRMVRQIAKRSGNAPALQGPAACNASAFMVTATMGALLRLWSYADTHIRQDDTLDMSPAEVDELVGLPGFAEALPDEWLRATEDGHVELPGYQAHNSVEAKKKAQTAKRVAKHRAATRNAGVTPVTQGSVTGALPDQTRPDQDQTSSLRSRERAGTRAPERLTAEAGTGEDGDAAAPSDTLRASARTGWELDRQWTLDELRALYPSNLHTDADWETAARQVAGHIGAERVTREQLLQLVRDFAAQVDAKGNRNTQYVENPVRHFDGRGKWRGPFRLPEAERGGPTEDPAAVDAWERLISSDGADRPPIAAAALKAIGGWPRVHERTTRETPHIRREFIEAFTARSAAA